ncbi:MAG: response regulator [Methanomicrobia archaeon]|nr:response regulator [Methanomicrobia archaeon]
MAKILVVDDAAFMRMMLKNILSANGHEVIGEAENGIQSMEKYEQLKPELITMDVVMPQMDGIEATKEIMRNHPEAKVVMCTAVGQQAKVLEAMKAGAKGYIVKPFQAPNVLEELKKVLSA